jgi:flagellar biosynthesis protein
MAVKKITVKQNTDEDVQPRQQAAALSYDPQVDQAPRVLAFGQGEIARQIISLAKKNGIPIHEDAALASALSSVNINEEIPPELYVVVAEVLSYLYRIQARRRELHGANKS